MSGTTVSSAGLDLRRRRILFRARHRGTKEMDLVMGRFADAEIHTMSEDDLTQFERLLEVPDRDLFAWVTGKEAAPANYASAVFRRLKGMHDG
jgi:antitoxin CptB